MVYHVLKLDPQKRTPVFTYAAVGKVHELPRTERESIKPILTSADVRVAGSVLDRSLSAFPFAQSLREVNLRPKHFRSLDPIPSAGNNTAHLDSLV